jgi:hypothetical protein
VRKGRTIHNYSSSRISPSPTDLAILGLCSREAGFASVRTRPSDRRTSMLSVWGPRALLVVMVLGASCQATRDGSGGPGDAGGDLSAYAACQVIAALDRSCSSDTDCVLVHAAVGCGDSGATGFRSNELTAFQGLEHSCAESYGVCQHPPGPLVVDDGSFIWSLDQVRVGCVSGTCTSYVAGCGGPCSPGTTCTSCSVPNHTAILTACYSICGADAGCQNSTRSSCTSGGWSSMVCAQPGATCMLLPPT